MFEQFLTMLTLSADPFDRSMALQFSLQNVFDLGKYTLTMVLHRPSQFRWAALVSFGAVCLASICYLAYAWKERGHLVHLKRKKQR